ncbi:hypothetical protein ANRL3_00902 [Anaerolineae bacterium]|nr:hypothetical protein ANRL3_00902 [Anaerolineae bacterium]
MVMSKPYIGLGIGDMALGYLEKPVPFMLRQAQHERNRLIFIEPFALNLSKCEVFRGALMVCLRLR